MVDGRETLLHFLEFGDRSDVAVVIEFVFGIVDAVLKRVQMHAAFVQLFANAGVNGDIF